MCLSTWERDMRPTENFYILSTTRRSIESMMYVRRLPQWYYVSVLECGHINKCCTNDKCKQMFANGPKWEISPQQKQKNIPNRSERATFSIAMFCWARESKWAPLMLSRSCHKGIPACLQLAGNSFKHKLSRLSDV